ncbi:MAG: hypothetical protein GXP29_13715 [Planctomycetes bacterium]|nr:hypothetical protein [Planctomycetota bacterium]
MTKPAVHFLVDVILLMAFITHLCIAVLVQFVFPKGTQAVGWSLWRLDYDAWSSIRFATLAAFTLCTLIHLILQWKWICNFITSRLSKRTGRKIRIKDGIKTIYGVATLITILTVMGVLLAVAEIQAVPPKPNPPATTTQHP